MPNSFNGFVSKGDKPIRSFVRSVQRGESGGTNDTDRDITINPVVVSNSIVILNEKLTSGLLYKRRNAEITTPTNLHLELQSSTSNNTAIKWQVIEFSKVKSLQKGTASISANTSTNISISAINPNKAILFYSLTGVDNINDGSAGNHYGEITNSTTLNFLAGYSMTIKWQVVEFY